jgi:hypothetical protein
MVICDAQGALTEQNMRQTTGLSKGNLFPKNLMHKTASIRRKRLRG